MKGKTRAKFGMTTSFSCLANFVREQ